MRINILIDDDLMNEAMKASGARTRKDVVNLALQELVQHKRKNLADLAGRIRFRDGFDHKAMRKLRG
jgi:Arc/MetJ family transcription regulator